MKTSPISSLCRRVATRSVLFAIAVFMVGAAVAEQPIYLAQGFSRPFVMAPILNSFSAISLQRHQSRTQLYREALEILKKNPAAADVVECPAGEPQAGEVCIRLVKKEEGLPSPPLVVAAAGKEAGKEAGKKPGAAASMKKTPVAEAQLPSVDSASDLQVKRRKLAVLFGNNGYLMPIPPLETPISDVEDIGRLLEERFGYEVRIVRDAKKSDVVNALNQVGAETSRDDSVLVVYAGHGYLMDDTKIGYWIPVDGSIKSPANWVSNADISRFLKNIQANQVILISDSCFSGSLTREEKMLNVAEDKDRGSVLDKRSVVAMSSGGEEPVSDEGKDGHSIFAWSLINALKSAEASTPGVKIFQVVKKEVVKDYSQEPQYGAVLSAGHMEGGEYFFEMKNR